MVAALQVDQAAPLEGTVTQRDPHRQDAVGSLAQVDEVVVSLGGGAHADLARSNVPDDLALVQVDDSASSQANHPAITG